MLKKEQIIKVLKKYGFYSLNRAPYLYQSNDTYGIYFIWPTKHYGTLERILFFEQEQALEEEVFKYWWFLNHKNKLDITAVFDNYETLSPKVTYRMDQIVLTEQVMKEFKNEEDILANVEDNVKKRQLLRTANILIQILHQKFKIQNETYFKVLELQENLSKLTSTYNKKYKQYNKSNEILRESYEILNDEIDESDDLTNTLYNELTTLSSVTEIRNFIESMFSYLIQIDSSDIHLQNVYLLNRYPFEIEDIKKKIDVLDQALKQKKKLFKPKLDVNQTLKEIDNKSQCKKMINVNLYIEKEKKRIQEQYEECKKIDENILGDYIVSFEKMNIAIPDIIESKKNKVFLKKEELTNYLKKKYDALSKSEKAACHIASSFLKDCLESLQQVNVTNDLNTNDLISKLTNENKMECFQEAFQLLDHYLNTKIRVKYFSILQMDTIENFITSLMEALNILNSIQIKLEQSFIGYYYHKNKDILPIYLKNLSYLNDKEYYIATIKENVPIYYSPVQIKKAVDIIDNEELEINESSTIFLLTHKVKIETNPKPIQVLKYEKDGIVKKKDMIIITNMKEKKVCTYFEDCIESNDGK